MELLWIIGGIVVLIVLLAWWSHARRRAALLDKYGDPEIVRGIMARKIWQGMTTDQLVDSWGRPAAIDERVYRSKISRTYKYTQSGKNRFRERVKLENGIVVGWDQK